MLLHSVCLLLFWLQQQLNNKGGVLSLSLFFIQLHIRTTRRTSGSSGKRGGVGTGTGSGGRGGDGGGGGRG